LRYLVTGGAGFVGSHLVEKLASDGHEVTVMDNYSNSNDFRAEGVKYLKHADVIFSPWDYKEEVDGIFHLATAPRSASLQYPIQDIATNCKGMIAVLELARRKNAKVVFTSNSGIYGSLDEYGCIVDTINEEAPNDPTTPYDVNKLASEYYCKVYYRLHGVRSTVVRFATVYGERQAVNELLNWRPLVATFVRDVLNKQDVFVNGDGEQTRDLIYVKDAVQGAVKAMESDVDNAEVFLLSTNIETSVNQVLEMVQNITGLRANVVHTAPLKGDIRRMRYDYSKANKVLGFKPECNLQYGITRMISMLLEQTS
jgi:UDP-glucose 4-epimerase